MPWITDMTHMPPPEMGDRRTERTEFFGQVARLGSLLGAKTSVLSAILCPGLPDKGYCGTAVEVLIPENNGEIQWSCPKCGDSGIIRGWKGSSWDSIRGRTF